MALQVLYQWDQERAEAATLFRAFDLVDYARETAPERAIDLDRERRAFEYAQRLVEGTLGHLGEIDELITSHAENWRLERMPVVDRNVLRLAIWELLYETDVPKIVVVNEAIELAKRFGSEQSGAFVNGLLDAVIHGERDLPGALH
jgi:N utilization substance protein B